MTAADRSAWCAYCNNAVATDDKGCKVCRCTQCGKQAAHGMSLVTMNHREHEWKLCLQCWRSK